jgi:hypothetical protein
MSSKLNLARAVGAENVPVKFFADLAGIRSGNLTWVCFEVPFSAELAFGSRARIAVCGTVNGSSYRSTIFPRGDGRHFMMLNRDLRRAAGAEIGDAVTVTMAIDVKPRTVGVPRELASLLRNQQRLLRLYRGLSYSHRKEYYDWISAGRKPQTRQARANKVIAMLRARLQEVSRVEFRENAKARANRR